ncbi:MAG: glycosyltransferase [Bacteroidia bacterium]
MKISVIVPSYNYARFLPDLFQSLLAQTYADWECLIVDNGSTDETEKLMESTVQSGNRFVYYKINSCNPSAARNFGLKKATGKFIQFLDADDVITRGKFELQLNQFAEDESVDIVYGDYVLTDEKLLNHIKPQKKLKLSQKPFNDFIRRWEKDLTIPIHSYLIKTECFEKWGLMDENIRTHEDWELQLNFSLSGAVYKYHTDVVAWYRIHKASSSRNDLTVNKKETLDVLMKYFAGRRTNSNQKFFIIMRYFEYTGDILLDKIRIGNLKFLEALRFPKRPLLNSAALLVFPFYLVYKILTKIFAQ